MGSSRVLRASKVLTWVVVAGIYGTETETETKTIRVAIHDFTGEAFSVQCFEKHADGSREEIALDVEKQPWQDSYTFEVTDVGLVCSCRLRYRASLSQKIFAMRSQMYSPAIAQRFGEEVKRFDFNATPWVAFLKQNSAMKHYWV